jgi:predicted nucleotide-binding protein
MLTATNGTTMNIERIIEIANECRTISEEVDSGEFKNLLDKISEAVRVVGRASTQSWLGYQAHVYYRGFTPPQPGDHFSSEWGFQSTFAHPTSGNWIEVSFEEVSEAVNQIAENPDKTNFESRSIEVKKMFRPYHSELMALLSVALESTNSEVIEELRDKAKKMKSSFSQSEFIQAEMPKGQVMTRDSLALSQGFQPPHHVAISCDLLAKRSPFQQLGELSNIAEATANYLRQKYAPAKTGILSGGKVFIGHGRSSDWKELSSFIGERLCLDWDEFNRESSAGLSIKERLESMLGQANFAFLVMTAEDEHADETIHARENVIHEIGLFQGRLGFNRAIILLEEGCQEFSNVHGIGQIRYPKGYISATYEEIRRVLEREGVLANGG